LKPAILRLLALGWLLYILTAGAAATDRSGANASLLLRQGSDALRQGDLKTAKSLFTRVLEIEPHNVEAHTFLGVIADRDGSLVEAERNFQAAVADAPASAEARNNYGAILLRLGRSHEATHQFERSLALKPNQPAALMNLANIRFTSGTSQADFNLARELLLKAISLYPDVEAERALVTVDCRLHDAKLALADYSRYRTTIAEQKIPQEPFKRRDLGAALINAQLYRQAMEELTAARQADPTDAQTVIMLAKAQRASGDMFGAGRSLESAVAAGLRTGGIYFELAKVYEATEHYENAIPAMRLAIELEPDNIDYRFNYGLLLTHSKAPQGAVIRLEEAVARFPKSAKLWFALGFAQLEDHRDSSARTSFARAAELDPTYTPAQVFLGVTALDQGNYKEAQMYYARALQLAPSVGILHEMIAEAMQKERPPNTAGAQAELKRSIQMDPSFAAAYLELGKLYLQEGNVALAIPTLEQAVRLDPAMTEAHFHLGRAYHRNKRDDVAQAEFDKFKQLTEQDKDKQVRDRQELVRKLANVLF
jgi:Tfp pilus assembly protein PilF